MHELAIACPDSAEVIEIGTDSWMWLLADASGTGGALGANRLYLAPAAAGALPHYHLRSSEAFYVLDGRLQILLDEQVHVVERGGFVVVPPGLHHAFAATPHTPADLLITLAPGIDRFEYFRALPAVLRGEVDEDDLKAMHGRFDVHFVASDVWSGRRSPASRTAECGAASGEPH